MGQTQVLHGSKNPSIEKEAEMTDLEKQWMDPHKRKILEVINDVNAKCHWHSVRDTVEIIACVRRLCLVIYSANDLELIQKCRDTFPSLIRMLRDSRTPFLLRLEIISAISLLCQGNQVNCRAWCAEGGIKPLTDQLREIPKESVLEPIHYQALQLNLWVVYTLRTLMCGSTEAIKSIVAISDFAQLADILVQTYDFKDVWQNSTMRQNYALDCCIILGIGGKKVNIL